MGTLAYSYYPNGYQYYSPPAPATWTDQVPGRIGSPVTAHTVAHDAAPGILWHRQRALFQGVQTASQAIPSSSWTPISFAELIDNYAGHSDAANTSRWYAPGTQSSQGAGDWYLCTGYVPYSSGGAGDLFIAGIQVNGGTIYPGNKIASGSGHAVTPMVVDLVALDGITASDYIELVAWQNSGSSVNTNVTNKSPTLTARWVCANTAWIAATTPALPGVPHTWAASDLATADLTGTIGGRTAVPLNRELRDVINYLNQPPIARITSEGTSQTIPSGGSTFTSINMVAETVDNYGGHSTSTNNSRYVCQRAGLYYIAGLAAFAEPGTSSGYRTCQLLVNGTTAHGGQTVIPETSGSSTTAIYAVAQLRLAVGDYVELQAKQTQGSSLSVRNGSGDCSRLIAVWRSR